MSSTKVQTNRLSLDVDNEVSVPELRIVRGTHQIMPTDQYAADCIAGLQLVRRYIAITGFDAMDIDLLRREMRGYLFGGVVGQQGHECQLLADQYIVEGINAGYLKLVRKRRSRR